MGFDLSRRYKRWRHGRGFGIHSPFAFSFITLSLRERLPYYSYDAIDALLLSTKATERLALSRRLRLIFRIAVRFKPETAIITGDDPKRLQESTLNLACRRITITDSTAQADLIIANDDSPINQLKEKTVIIFPDTNRGGLTECCRIWNGISRGMRFDNGKGFTVIVINRELPRQQFDVKF